MPGPDDKIMQGGVWAVVLLAAVAGVFGAISCYHDSRGVCLIHG